MVVAGGLSVEIIVNDVEDAAHPVRVARVDELVGPSVEASELGLPLREPKHQTRHIQVLQPLQQGQGSHSAKGKSAVRFSSDHVGNAALVGLRQKDRFCDSFEDILRQVESDRDDGDYIDGSEVAFSLLVHHEFAALLASFEESVQFLPVKQVVSVWPELQDG